MTIRQRSSGGFCSAQFWIYGQVYQFTFNGKKGMPQLTSKKEARDFEAELKRKVKTGTLLKDADLKNFEKFFEEIYMDYSRKHKVPLSVDFDEFHGRYLVSEFGAKTLTQISPRMIENYLSKLVETKTRYDQVYSPVTVRRRFNMLNQIFNMAIRERITNENPCRLVSRTVLKSLSTWQNRERWLNKYSPDEEGRLFAAFNDYGEHIAAICRIVLNTGIRPPKEVLGIKKEHVNLSDEQRYCKVDRADVLLPPKAVLIAKGKNGRPRVLPLNRTAQGVFDVLIKDSTTGVWLFTNRDDEPLQSIKKGFAAACARAKIENLRAYDLRH